MLRHFLCGVKVAEFQLSEGMGLQKTHVQALSGTATRFINARVCNLVAFAS